MLLKSLTHLPNFLVVKWSTSCMSYIDMVFTQELPSTTVEASAFSSQKGMTHLPQRQSLSGQQW